MGGSGDLIRREGSARLKKKKSFNSNIIFLHIIIYNNSF